MEESNLADTTTPSYVRRGVRHLTFMDLPGEIRNNIYEHHGCFNRCRLFNSVTAYQPRSKPDKKKKKSFYSFLRNKAKKSNRRPFRLVENRRLLYFTPSIIRVNRQIRKEYASLVFRNATLQVDIASEPHIWDRFVKAIGEDVIKEVAKLKIINVPEGCRVAVRPGHRTMFVYLHDTSKPVIPGLRSCGHDGPRQLQSLDSQLECWQMHQQAIQGIERSVEDTGKGWEADTVEEESEDGASACHAGKGASLEASRRGVL